MVSPRPPWPQVICIQHARPIGPECGPDCIEMTNHWLKDKEN